MKKNKEHNHKKKYIPPHFKGESYDYNHKRWTHIINLINMGLYGKFYDGKPHVLVLKVGVAL